jgi:hypothetical protein
MARTGFRAGPEDVGVDWLVAMIEIAPQLCVAGLANLAIGIYEIRPEHVAVAA